MVADIPVTKDNVKERTAMKDKFFSVSFIDVNSFVLDLFFCSVLLYLYDNTEFFCVGYSWLTVRLQDCIKKRTIFLRRKSGYKGSIQILPKQGDPAVSIDFFAKKTYHTCSCEHFYAIDYGQKTAIRNR